MSVPAGGDRSALGAIGVVSLAVVAVVGYLLLGEKPQTEAGAGVAARAGSSSGAGA
jgi:hypothetical protein